MPRTTERLNTPPARCAAVDLARFKLTPGNLPLVCPPIFNPLSRAFPFQTSRHITALAPDLYQIQTSVYTPTLGNFRQFARTVKRGGQPRYSSGLHREGGYVQDKLPLDLFVFGSSAGLFHRIHRRRWLKASLHHLSQNN